MKRAHSGMTIFMDAALLLSSTMLFSIGLWIMFLFLRLEDQQVGTFVWTIFFLAVGIAILLLAASYRYAFLFYKQGKRIRSMMCAGFPMMLCIVVQWVIAFF